MKTKEIISAYRNYIIIGILSALAVFFLPMLGSTAGLAFMLPNTAAGWIVYIITKVCIVAINVMIFDQFMKRAKINVKDNEYFKWAEAILFENGDEEEALPAQIYISKMYRSKVTTTVVFTILGVFGFTNAVLTFDWISMLSYTFTIVMALVFGWISMGEAEIIWIERHYKYAKRVEKERAAMAVASPQLPEPKNYTPIPSGGATLLVSTNSSCPTGNTN